MYESDIEERKKSNPTSVQADRLGCVTDNWEYRDIPDSGFSYAWGAWYGPTPSAVQRVIETLTECFNYIEDLGFIPFTKDPDMTDEDVILVIEAIDDELMHQFRPWGYAAGYSTWPSFGNISVEDKRTMVAMIRETINDNPELRTMWVEEG